MPRTRYQLLDPAADVVLQGESGAVLGATKARVENLPKTNPARAALSRQMLLMEEALTAERDCDVPRCRHGSLADVLLKLFDAGDAQIVRDGRVYVRDMVRKENWTEGRVPGLHGGHGGFIYRAEDGAIEIKRTTWIS